LALFLAYFLGPVIFETFRDSNDERYGFKWTARIFGWFELAIFILYVSLAKGYEGFTKFRKQSEL